MNELAFKRKNFDSDCLSERTSIEAERERLKVDIAALFIIIMYILFICF
jgi:hypothetical protein